MIKLFLLIIVGLLLLASPVLIVVGLRYWRKRSAAQARQEIEAEIEWVERVLQKKTDAVPFEDKNS